jgi:uncharacterized membrane protein YphA (DoxX/SURF4 family)
MDVGLLILRIGLSVTFIAHGAGKFQELDNTIAFFGSIGLSPFFAYLVAAIEFFGGLAILLGIFTDIAGYLLAIIMLVATYKIKYILGFLGGYELDFVLFSLALGIALVGPGKYALPCCFGKCEMGKEMKK